MEYLPLIQERYACKSYSSRPVSREILLKILEAGRLAPTAKNLQEWHVYVMTTPENLEKIDSITPCRYGAPVVLLMTWDKNMTYIYPDGIRSSGLEDASIVMTQIMLGARNNGVESCWINNFDLHKAKEVFSLPENEEVAMLLDLGYPSDHGKPLPNHFSRKPLEETVTWM